MYLQRKSIVISVIVVILIVLALSLPTKTCSEESPDYERFTLILNDKAIIDNDHGLVWEREPNKKTMNWHTANAYCYHLNILGSTNWRLPTLEELSTLIDIRESNPSLPLGHPFIDINIGYYWTVPTVDKWSEPVSDDDVSTNADLSALSEDEIPLAEMTISINGGAFYYFDKDEEHCVWCVQEEDHL